MSNKVLKRKLDANMSYPEMLSCYAADDLKKIAKAWQLKGYSKWKKEELVENLSEKVYSDLPKMMNSFNLDHISIVSELMGGNNVFMNYPVAAGDLVDYGLVLEGKMDDQRQVVLPSFVAENFESFYNEYKDHLTFNTILKDYLELAMDLYGVIKTETFVDLFYNFNDQAVEKNIIEDCLEYSIMKTKNTLKEGDFLYYYRLAEYEKVYNDIQLKEELDYRPITQELLQVYLGNGNNFETSNHKQLRNILDKHFNGNDDLYIDVLDELKIMLSYNHGVSDFIQLFTKKNQTSDMVGVKAFADLIIAINNEMPHFELKGHTPSSLSSYQKQMPIIKGDKVGRNDPCPCGSGKKYKKCCLN